MATLNLTPREAELLCGVIAVMKAEVYASTPLISAFLTSSQITWADVAAKANFTNAKQARDKWPAVRDKIIACGTKKEEKSETGEEAVGKVKGGATPKKPAANKRKAGK